MKHAVPAVAALVSFFPFSATGQQLQKLPTRHTRQAVVDGSATLISAMQSDQQMQFAIILPLRNQDRMQALLAELYDPTSQNYRRFLAPSQFLNWFGPTDDDYQAVITFAESNGLTVTATPPNHLVVDVSGTVQQIESAFNVHMNWYQHPTENRIFFSPDQEPTVSMAVPLWHIAGLNNFSIPTPPPFAPPDTFLPDPVGSGPQNSFLPSDFRAAYYGGTALTGSGQSVGIGGFDGFGIDDVVSNFYGAASYTVAPTCPTNQVCYILTYTAQGVPYQIPINAVLIDNAIIDPQTTEITGDIPQVIGMAPGVSEVRVYVAPLSTVYPNYKVGADVDMFNQMAMDSTIKQFSVSWNWIPSDYTYLDPIFEQLVAQGQDLFIASGDWGSWPINPNTAPAWYFPEEDPYVTSVGGTRLVTNQAAGPWSSETGWSGSGGGLSPDNIGIPSWQDNLSGVNGSSNTLRNVPDVSGDALNIYACGLGSCFNDGAGTSYASPRWAGFLALANEQANSLGYTSVGFINPALYVIGASASYNTDFHDIKMGSNGTFTAATGYDLVTGWGTPNGQNMIDGLTGQLAPAPAPTFVLQYGTCAIQGATFAAVNYVSIYDLSSQAIIYYTTDGSSPKNGYGTTQTYSGPVAYSGTSGLEYTNPPVPMPPSPSTVFNAIAVTPNGTSAMASFVAPPTCANGSLQDRPL